MKLEGRLKRSITVVSVITMILFLLIGFKLWLFPKDTTLDKVWGIVDPGQAERQALRRAQERAGRAERRAREWPESMLEGRRGSKIEISEEVYKLTFEPKAPAVVRYLAIILLGMFGYSLPWIGVYTIKYISGDDKEKGKTEKADKVERVGRPPAGK